MPVHGGSPVALFPLLVVSLGLSDFGISYVGFLLKCSKKHPGHGG